MRYLLFNSLTIVLLIMLQSIAFAETASTGPELVVERYTHAWNTHSMKSLDNVIADTADWVTVFGKSMNGREEILLFLTGEHSTWAKTTTMVSSKTIVRQLRPDIALIRFHWEITGAIDEAGKEMAPFKGIGLFVVTKEASDWQIVFGQVTSLR